MSELLHAWALAPAAIGTCCLAADRRRVRGPELAASLLMLAAMADAAVTGVVATVAWAALLLAAAMVLASVRGARRRAARMDADADRTMTVHTAVGLVAMAALMLLAGHGAASGSNGHAHGVSAAGLVAAVLLGCAGYTLWSAAAAVRAHPRLDRAQYAAMGASVAVMAVAMAA